MKPQTVHGDAVVELLPLPSAPGYATALKGRDVGRRCGSGQCSCLGRGRASGRANLAAHTSWSWLSSPDSTAMAAVVSVSVSVSVRMHWCARSRGAGRCGLGVEGNEQRRARQRRQRLQKRRIAGRTRGQRLLVLINPLALNAPGAVETQCSSCSNRHPGEPWWATCQASSFAVNSSGKALPAGSRATSVSLRRYTTNFSTVIVQRLYAISLP
jgi:hypothetical protein